MTTPVPFSIRVPENWLSQIDEWRRVQPDLPTRAEAVRRIVSQFLDDSTKIANPNEGGKK